MTEKGSTTAPTPKSDVIVVIPGKFLYPPPPSVMFISSILPYADVDIVENFNFEFDMLYDPFSG